MVEPARRQADLRGNISLFIGLLSVQRQAKDLLYLFAALDIINY
jgi:hypothetical protein